MTRISSSVRESVRQRAHQRCEYCLKPEAYSGFSFHVDHIIPVRRHGGSTEVDNLAWACFECNTCKAGDIASYDTETGTLTPLFNPRIERWEHHFEMDGSVIVGKTATGRITIRILEMNHPDQVELRQFIIELGHW